MKQEYIVKKVRFRENESLTVSLIVVKALLLKNKRDMEMQFREKSFIIGNETRKQSKEGEVQRK